MPPPPPPPPPAGYSAQQRATPQFEDLGWPEIKERVVRPYYLPASFLLGALTLGLRTSALNYEFASDPLGYLATAAVTGLLCCAFAWVLFEFTEAPGAGKK
ncbi:hypothetical protein Rsub_03602 [Raphidocelis subcapitata]|uniref:Uncharacterized protein n=1 Tax=Raphidocelis subcapitata TaxID=307507 RepID=A0A2V0NX77_9CHLO|nr:hypothetical protein Rsub_03602 [Raphidocelis subcapitata]|eukprot:GBF91282.1 hypothetical protein Rsub_03602 [Raphidocelis subcapitata]